MMAMRVIVPAQWSHLRMSMANTRRSKAAQGRRRVVFWLDCWLVVPLLGATMSLRRWWAGANTPW